MSFYPNAWPRQVLEQSSRRRCWVVRASSDCFSDHLAGKYDDDGRRHYRLSDVLTRMCSVIQASMSRGRYLTAFGVTATKGGPPPRRRSASSVLGERPKRYAASAVKSRASGWAGIGRPAGFSLSPVGMLDVTCFFIGSPPPNWLQPDEKHKMKGGSNRRNPGVLPVFFSRFSFDLLSNSEARALLRRMQFCD